MEGRDGPAGRVLEALVVEGDDGAHAWLELEDGLADLIPQPLSGPRLLLASQHAEGRLEALARHVEHAVVGLVARVRVRQALDQHLWAEEGLVRSRGVWRDKGCLARLIVIRSMGIERQGFFGVCVSSGVLGVKGGCTLMTAVLLALHAQWRGVSPSAFCTLRGALRCTSMRTTSGLPLRAALLQVQVEVEVGVRCEGGVGRIIDAGEKGREAEKG
jgi:hypothetical protein